MDLAKCRIAVLLGFPAMSMGDRVWENLLRKLIEVTDMIPFQRFLSRE